MTWGLLAKKYPYRGTCQYQGYFCNEPPGVQPIVDCKILGLAKESPHPGVPLVKYFISSDQKEMGKRNKPYLRGGSHDAQKMVQVWEVAHRPGMGDALRRNL